MADDEQEQEKKVVSPQRRPTAPRDWPDIGDLNILEPCIGQRGTGKSTFQCRRVWELNREYGGAYVIGHSLGARFPERLPAELGGHPLPIVYYPTIEKLDKGLRKHPQKWHVLAADIDDMHAETADDLIKYVRKLARACRESAYREEHGLIKSWSTKREDRRYLGIPCVPIVVIIDEGIAIDAAATGSRGGADENRWFRSFIYSLRHEHIAFLYSIQNASARSWHVLSEATTIRAFSTRHTWALQSLRAAGATKEEIAAISNLPPHEHIDFGPATRKRVPENELPKTTTDPEPEPIDEVKGEEDKPGTNKGDTT